MTTLVLLVTLSFLAAQSTVAWELHSDPGIERASSEACSGEVKILSTSPCQTGYLFINRTYIQPPYQIELHTNQLSINGESIQLGSLNLHDFVDDPNQCESTKRETHSVEESEVLHSGRQAAQGTILVAFTPSRERWFEQESPSTNADQNEELHRSVSTKLTDAIQATLRMGGITILADEQAPLFLDHSYGLYEFLAAITESSNTSPQLASLVAPPKELTQDSEKLTWQSFFQSQPHDPILRGRALADFSEINSADALGNQICTANLLSAFLGYPLTLSAMILVVVAFGHLINNKPQLDPSLSPPEIRRVIVKSLVIIALLSMIDLTWTIMAHASGTMREMNPLGVSLIGNPVHLILFKIGVVSLSIGLLYSQHHRPNAQAATWWSCLTLTLLTARWLTFQSMFL